MQTHNATSASIAKIDASRARRLGNMLVTDIGDFHEPRQVLFDLAKADAKSLLADYQSSRSKFATSPFDPEGDKLRFYRKGYTIWSGYPGAGKTTALRQLINHLLFTKEQVFVASLEEHPRDVIVRLAGVCFGRKEPTAHQLQWYLDYYAERLKIWGVTGLSSHKEILGTIQGLATKGQCTQAFIDSLMCLDIHAKDIEAQRLFANRLAAVAIDSDIHLHLVAHPRKAVSVEQEPDINDIAGGADYGRLAHNIGFFRRGANLPYGSHLSPMKLALRKQREDPAYHGDIDGWFNRQIRQFKLDQFDQKPTQYLPKAAYDYEH